MPPTLLSFLTDYFVIFIWLALVILLARTMITPHGGPNHFYCTEKNENFCESCTLRSETIFGH